MVGVVALQPDIILANNTPTTTAMMQQTRTIPIISAVVADPVGSGFVASLPRPGGNVTGFTLTDPTIVSNGWSYSERSRRASTGLPSCLTPLSGIH